MTLLPGNRIRLKSARQASVCAAMGEVLKTAPLVQAEATGVKLAGFGAGSK